MEQHQIQCEALINKCKQEAKQLAELAATCHKVHWSQSCFVSFCISVEDVLSYGVRRRYSASKQLSSPAKILADLGRTFPVAAATFDKCYGSKSASSSPDDYAHVMTSSSTERKILWLRVAIIESSLVTIVNEIIKNAGKYYTDHSILCHPVYGEVFGYLLDGPCSIRVSRLKVADTALTSPTPAEIVKRHNKVLSASVSKLQQDGQSQTGTEEAWDHVKSLYQTSTATCLFGKNNIHVQPAGFSDTLAGYLTLQRVMDGLQLKWIPNSLLKTSSTASSSLWDHVLSLDIGSQVAHIHCHRSGGSAKMILIGYDGIAYPRLIFSHQPSLFQFLECLENNLLPRGALEPPLWYIKAQTTKAKRSSWRHLATPFPSPSSEWGVGEGEEWWEGVDVWNQVFRLRFSGGRNETPKLSNDTAVKGHVPHLPLNLHSLHGPAALSSDSSSSDSSPISSSPSPPLSEEDQLGGKLSPFGVSIDKPTSLARKDWEKFQLKVSKQLLARYFYSWLSYCRHMKKVHHLVAHMVDASVPVQQLDPANYTNDTVEELWADFQENRNDSNWSRLLKAVYMKGISHSLRPKIWPWLLGLYPVTSSDEEIETVRTQGREKYSRELEEWKKVEVIHVRILEAAERERAERWRREFATHISHTDGFRNGGEGEREGDGGVDKGESEKEEDGEVDGEGEMDAEQEPETGSEENSPDGRSGTSREDSGAVTEEGESKGEGGGEGVVGGGQNLLPSAESSNSVTPVPMQEHAIFGKTQTPPSHTPSTSTPPLTPPSQGSQSPTPDTSTLSDLSLFTQSTTSPLLSTQSSHNYIISPQNDTITKTRSSSVDSGHSSNCNLGNSIGSSHGNGPVNGCHSDDPVHVEWNGDSSMEERQDGVCVNNEVTLTVVVDSAVVGEGEEEEEVAEGEGEMELDEKGRQFADELIKIDKDIPRCDRDYWFFKDPENLTKLRNIVSTYVWTHLEMGYYQGMCDLLAPLLVVLEDEALTYACYLYLMKTAILLFPPHTAMHTKLSNLKALLQVLEPDFFQYLSERPLGDGLFYCYRWFLVSYKREFEYSDVFRLWETWWTASHCSSAHFLEFCGLAIMTQFKPAIMDAHMDSSDILNLFTDLADSKAINCVATITLAQSTIRDLVCALTKRE